jgi:hypothetical protein
MKTALCLYGPLRYTALVRAAIQQHLLPHWDITIFACVRPNGSLGQYQSEPNHPTNQIVHNKPLASDNFVSNLRDLEQLMPSSVTTLDQPVHCPSTMPLAYWHNLACQKTVIEMKNQYPAQFDFCIVSRADVLYQDSIPHFSVDPNKLSFHKKFGTGWPSDFWYAGPSAMVDVIANRAGVDEQAQVHPNQYLLREINQHNLPTFFADLPIDVVQRRYTGWWWTPYVRDPTSLKEF